MVTMTQAPAFDPVTYKRTTHAQWQEAADAWHRWSPVLEDWLGEATEIMLDLAGLTEGQKVLDVAAGAGGQSVAAAHRVGPTGSVLATDISENILRLAEVEASKSGLSNIDTRVMDGENLDVEEAFFDAVISRVGLIYFPDQQAALTSALRALKPNGKIAAIVYSTPERNKFFSIPVSIIRTRAQLPPPAPGQPGPFSLGSPGALQRAYEDAGFRDVEIRIIAAPLRLASASECVRFEKESFGALHQMLSGLSESERESAWSEIEKALAAFEGPTGFEGPCELVVGVGTK